MNRIMRHYYPIFRTYQGLRPVLMESLEDGDLAFRPTPANPTLGHLCHQIGRVEESYVRSFSTFRLDLPPPDEAGPADSKVAGLQAWYADLDRRLEEAVAALSDEEAQNRLIDRGHFSLPPQINLEVYKEALHIFYGKASVYVQGLGRNPGGDWVAFIG